GISINLFFYGKDASNSDNLKTLRMFDVGASLGGGANNDDESFQNVVISEQILEKSNVKFLGKIDIIKAIGESMEPYIMDGDSCFIAVGAEFKDGEIYAINTPDGLMIKECYKQGNEFMLISYNPIYLPVRYSIYECKIVGMFVGIIRGRGKFKINLNRI
ncbi:helix-turn-helix transcriptional regulator, partial [Campylobacter ureolyticus]